MRHRVGLPAAPKLDSQRLPLVPAMGVMLKHNLCATGSPPPCSAFHLCDRLRFVDEPAREVGDEGNDTGLDRSRLEAVYDLVSQPKQ